MANKHTRSLNLWLYLYGLCMCVCVCVCVYSMCVCTYLLCVYIYMYMCVYIYIYTCIWTYICICESEIHSIVSISLQPHGLACQAPVHGILQARILEWVAIPFSRVSSQPRASNPGLPHCWQILYCLSHQGSPCVYIYMYMYQYMERQFMVYLLYRLHYFRRILK